MAVMERASKAWQWSRIAFVDNNYSRPCTTGSDQMESNETRWTLNGPTSGQTCQWFMPNYGIPTGATSASSDARRVKLVRRVHGRRHRRRVSMCGEQRVSFQRVGNERPRVMKSRRRGVPAETNKCSGLLRSRQKVFGKSSMSAGDRS